MAAFGAASSGIIPTLGAIWVLTKSRLGPAPVPISCAFAPASRNHPEITRLAPLGAGRSDTERWRIVIAVMVGSAAGLVRQRARPRRRRRRAAQAAQGPAQAAPGRTPNAEHTRRRVRPAQSASGAECVRPRVRLAQSTPGPEHTRPRAHPAQSASRKQTRRESKLILNSLRFTVSFSDFMRRLSCFNGAVSRKVLRL